MMESPVTKAILSNELTVLLREIHTVPVISQWIWYRVGSRNEFQGKTGISHWVEHMQFKGTQRFPLGILDRVISREGGIWNALTSLDWTVFFETMPAERIDLVLDIEADRMTNSLFLTDDVELEKGVILSERQGHENEPLFRLSEAVQASAFLDHAYRHQVIGEAEDIKSIQRADLIEHYRKYYHPRNAVLVLTGDFNNEEMLDKVIRAYEKIPSVELSNFSPNMEPEQSSERRVEIGGPGDTTYIQIAYRSPEATHPDFFPFIILDSMLSGPSTLNMFSGGISNITSRLYQAVVDKEFAVSLRSMLYATIDPFINIILTILHPNSNIQNVLDVIEEQINRIQELGPKPEELIRALKQSKALFAYGSERITNQAFWLGISEMISTENWLSNFQEKLSAVAPEDVQRVAKKYLNKQKRIVGVYRPNKN
jgi:zinc protease